MRTLLHCTAAALLLASTASAQQPGPPPGPDPRQPPAAAPAEPQAPPAPAGMLALRAPDTVDFGSPFIIEVDSQPGSPEPDWPDGFDARLDGLTQFDGITHRRFEVTAWRSGAILLPGGHLLEVRSSLGTTGAGGSAELPDLPSLGGLGWRDLQIPVALLLAALAIWQWRRSLPAAAVTATSTPTESTAAALSRQLAELTDRELHDRAARRAALVELDALLRGILQARLGGALLAATVTELRHALSVAKDDQVAEVRDQVIDRLRAHRQLLFTGDAPDEGSLRDDLQTVRELARASFAAEVQA